MVDHYFSEKPESPLSKITIPVEIDGKMYTFTTSSSVFSHGRLDTGTKVLVEALELREKDEFLDLGCAWGFVGIYASRKVKSVTMVDINERAVELAEFNCKQNKVKAEVLKSNGFESLDDRKFDCIATNPPIHAGKGIIEAWIQDSKAHLKKSGRFYLVAKTKLGAKLFGDYIAQVFGNCKIASIESGYRVFLAER